MSIWINILWIVLWNILIPIMIGFLCTMFLKTNDKNNLALNFVIGFIVMIGIFQPITLLAIYFKASLSFLTIIMKLLWIVLSVLSFVLNWKRIFRCICSAPELLKKMNFFLVGAILLILIQAYFYVAFEHIDDDDAFFVATATTSIANDNLYIVSPYTGELYKKLPTRYILSPFSIFYAVMSKLAYVHTTIYAHLFLPIILLMFVYCVYYLWGKEWFRDKRTLGLFLILLSFINMFGNYSEFTTQSFLLFRLWQGKAFLAAGIIPFILYLCYKIRKEDKQIMYWGGLFLGTAAASHVSSMGIFLTPVCIGVWALADLIMTKKIKRPIFYIGCCLPCILCGVVYLIIS